MNENQPEKMPPVPPFVRFVASAVPMVFDDSLSYYEALCALWKYIQGMTDVINNNATLEEEYIEKFNELKTFVDEYFDNLDVQEEINNKLDSMVEDGTLEEILSHYIDENVVRKDTYATSETGGAVKVGDTLTINENGVLNQTPFLNYLPIDTHVVRYHGTGGYSTVYYAIIDSEYKPDLTIANDTVNTVQQSGDNAMDNKSTLTVNAGLFNTSTSATTGVIIKNGQIVKLNDSMGNDREILYMTSDGTLHSITDNTSADQLLTLGAVWAVQGWYPFVKDGQDLTGERTPTDYQPRSVIGQDSDGRYIIMCNMGRSYYDSGMSAVDCLNFCTSIGFTPYFLYNLDGGASVNFVDRGIRLNGLIDGENRKVANFITWSSNSAKENGTFNVANSTYHKNVQNMRQSIPVEFKGKTSVYDSSVVTVDGASHYFMFGDLVVVYIKFTNNAQLNSYARIVGGFPKLPSIMSDMSILASKQAGDHGLGTLYMDQDGYLRVAGSNNLPAGTWFTSFVYSTNGGRSDTSTPE